MDGGVVLLFQCDMDTLRFMMGIGVSRLSREDMLKRLMLQFTLFSANILTYQFWESTHRHLIGMWLSFVLAVTVLLTFLGEWRLQRVGTAT